MASKRLKKKRWKEQGGTLRCTFCGKLLFILCGAFPGLGERLQSSPIGFLREAETAAETVGPEDFVEFDMERELLGQVICFVTKMEN